MEQTTEDLIEFSQEERDFQTKNRNVYNSGRIRESFEAAAEFHQNHPESVLAKLEHAIKGGDYSYDSSLDETTRETLRNQAKVWIAEIFHHPQLQRYPAQFIRRVRNEFYWFFELHEEQYRLGLEEQAKGAPRSHYPQCVGASAQARKVLIEKEDLAEAERWAALSLAAFYEFEKEDPTWYNINYFAAQALAVLGRYKEAMAAFLDMFRKQQGPVNEAEVQAFRSRIDDIQRARAACLKKKSRQPFGGR